MQSLERKVRQIIFLQNQNSMSFLNVILLHSLEINLITE